ncbi:hypothetical protein FACS189472_07980 [Alphaproteobacteria bacterium]|nr:hypothetical protein FACS189472_07980 [Alphaproteobacteria bacterium]
MSLNDIEDIPLLSLVGTDIVVNCPPKLGEAARPLLEKYSTEIMLLKFGRDPAKMEQMQRTREANERYQKNKKAEKVDRSSKLAIRSKMAAVRATLAKQQSKRQAVRMNVEAKIGSSMDNAIDTDDIEDIEDDDQKPEIEDENDDEAAQIASDEAVVRKLQEEENVLADEN